jgi:hypothetical protein
LVCCYYDKSYVKIIIVNDKEKFSLYLIERTTMILIRIPNYTVNNKFKGHDVHFETMEKEAIETLKFPHSEV